MARKKKTESALIDIKELQPGMQVKLHQKIKELNAKGEEKERTQFFAGLIIGRQGGNEATATITVRKESDGIAVEKIFPIALPSITKVELMKEYNIRQSKLYFLRKKNAKLKESKSKKAVSDKKKRDEANK